MVAGTSNQNASPIEVLRVALDDLRAMDTSKMGHAAQTARLDAIRRSAESLGKLEPPPRANAMSVEDFLDAEGGLMRRVIEALFIELEPYPEVRSKVLDRLRDDGLVQPLPPRKETP